LFSENDIISCPSILKTVADVIFLVKLKVLFTGLGYAITVALFNSKSFVDKVASATNGKVLVTVSN